MAKCPVFYQAATEDIPVGGIILWSGAADAIPAGWHLCDGTRGTPDLRGRFVLGADGTYSVGAKGGEETHTLTVAEMPSHSHIVYTGRTSDQTGNHPYYGEGHKSNPYFEGPSSDIGGSEPHNNMPPYYALCYIMKL